MIDAGGATASTGQTTVFKRGKLGSFKETLVCPVEAVASTAAIYRRRKSLARCARDPDAAQEAHDPESRRPEARVPKTHDPEARRLEARVPEEARVQEARAQEASVQEARAQEARVQEARVREQLRWSNKDFYR